MLAKRRKGVTFSVKDFYDCLPAAGVAHPELGGNVETVLALGKSRGLIDEHKGDKYRESCKPSTLVMVSTGDYYHPLLNKKNLSLLTLLNWSFLLFSRSPKSVAPRLGAPS